RLGTPQADDQLIHERPQEPKWFVRGGTTEDGHWVVISISRGSSFENLISLVDLGDPLAPKLDAPVIPLITEWDAEYSVIGNDGPVTGREDEHEFFYNFVSFTTPATNFRHDVATNTGEIFQAPAVAFNPADYVTEQIFYRSKDGTRVPMFISHRKGLKI